MGRPRSGWRLWNVLVAATMMARAVVGNEVLQTNGFVNCVGDATINVEKVNIRYDNDNKTVVFDIAGTSKREQNVTAVLDVTAFGKSVYSNSFNPCEAGTFVARLCPVPEGPFSAWGEQKIPSEFADMVPSIAFQVPDISAKATLKLKRLDTDEDVACIQSEVSNGKTVNIPAVSYITTGIVGAALVASGVSAIGSVMAGGGAAGGGGGGAGTVSPGFTEMVGWFQGLAMNGMMSVNYPPIYRSFTKNFGFSVGIIPIASVQRGIDAFRARTGGNLTEDNYDYLNNATLLFPGGSQSVPNNAQKAKRAFESFETLVARQLGFNTTIPEGEEGTGIQKTVSGIKAFAEQLRVPESDVFMTILLIVAIIIAAIVLFMVLFKLILELWALFGNFPEKLSGFRKHYWGSIARAITCLVFLLYGIWVIYCVFQFTRGDSWAATLLAAITLAIFTGILGFFIWKIWSKVQEMKRREGDTNKLYDDKETWTKYSIFYDCYRRGYWWLFVPVIGYMLAKGIVLAAADGSGRMQTISVLIIEAIMLVLLLWSRPYERKSGNVINIVIAVVRVLSVVCILVFVEEFGIEESTQTVTGIVLIAVQSTLTVVLVILIAWNGINACCQANPHRKRRKEMEKLANGKDLDDLTPLDARNSLLIVDRPSMSRNSFYSRAGSLDKPLIRPGTAGSGYRPATPGTKFAATMETFQPPMPVLAPSGGPHYRPYTPTTSADLGLNLSPGKSSLKSHNDGRSTPQGQGAPLILPPITFSGNFRPLTPNTSADLGLNYSAGKGSIKSFSSGMTAADQGLNLSKGSSKGYNDGRTVIQAHGNPYGNSGRFHL